ncbi:MAG: sugar ABC transporter permease [Actinomycetota bacterium]|nr:sugar ABC transporter permease [Actinomycetota bacterium]
MPRGRFREPRGQALVALCLLRHYVAGQAVPDLPTSGSPVVSPGNVLANVGELAATNALEPVGVAPGGRTPSRSWWRETASGVVPVLPALVVLGTFVYGPAVLVVAMSFFHWNLAGFSQSQFAGLSHYRALLNPVSGFVPSLGVTAYYVGVMVPATVVMALLLAMLLRDSTKRVRGLSFFRAVVFLPYVTPSIATAVIWVFIFDPQFGLANAALRLVHLPAVGWLSSTHWALPAVMIDSMWKQVGFSVVLFLAGLSRIPTELMEAARLDGVGPTAIFRRIVLPYLSPVTLAVVMLTTIASMQTFGSIYAMTGGQGGGGGGPIGSTTTTAVYLYKVAFVDFHYGFGATVAVALFVLILGLILVQRRVGERRTFYR